MTIHLDGRPGVRGFGFTVALCAFASISFDCRPFTTRTLKLNGVKRETGF